jgi:Ni2+-binding GTPase involved in maturation of urease and hydrogenase
VGFQKNDFGVSSAVGAGNTKIIMKMILHLTMPESGTK